VRWAGSLTVCRPAGLACERGASSSCLAVAWLQRGANEVDLKSDMPVAVFSSVLFLEAAWLA
jgi:hypothetical protein